MRISTTTFNGSQMTTDKQSRNSPRSGLRSDAFRLETVALLIPLESYNLHFRLNYEIILNIFTIYFSEDMMNKYYHWQLKAIFCTVSMLSPHSCFTFELKIFYCFCWCSNWVMVNKLNMPWGWWGISNSLSRISHDGASLSPEHKLTRTGSTL